jgi:hypothetical protein
LDNHISTFNCLNNFSIDTVTYFESLQNFAMGDRDVSNGIDPQNRFLSAGFKTNVDETLSKMLNQTTITKKRFCVECGTEIIGEGIFPFVFEC